MKFLKKISESILGIKEESTAEEAPVEKAVEKVTAEVLQEDKVEETVSKTHENIYLKTIIDILNTSKNKIEGGYVQMRVRGANGGGMNNKGELTVYSDAIEIYNHKDDDFIELYDKDNRLTSKTQCNQTGFKSRGMEVGELTIDHYPRSDRHGIPPLEEPVKIKLRYKKGKLYSFNELIDL